MLYSFPWDDEVKETSKMSNPLTDMWLQYVTVKDTTTLNLVNEDNGEIKYKISKFPDGQQTIDLIDVTPGTLSNYTTILKSRLNNFKDLELIICTVAALRNIKKDCRIELYVPYFLGSRSDRKFVKGGSHYIKQVIGPLINRLNFQKVTVMDPHSYVLEGCIENFEGINNFDLVKMALIDIDNEINAQERVMFLSPDGGAFKKIFDVGDKFGVKEIVTCSKHRDIITGNIDYTEVPISREQTDKSMVIIDDICDGGRTFIEIAKVIREKQKEYGTNGKLYLVVTHGIFSKGLEPLDEFFDGVFSTNSYSDLEGPKLKQKNVFN